jgi:hypothetical protein
MKRQCHSLALSPSFYRNIGFHILRDFPQCLKVNNETSGVPKNMQRLIFKHLKTDLHCSYVQIFISYLKGIKPCLL